MCYTLLVYKDGGINTDTLIHIFVADCEKDLWLEITTIEQYQDEQVSKGKDRANTKYVIKEGVKVPLGGYWELMRVIQYNLKNWIDTQSKNEAVDKVIYIYEYWESEERKHLYIKEQNKLDIKG